MPVMKSGKRPVKIIAVAGGKGGVGKSLFSLAFSAALADRGHQVVIADMDLGAANLHTYLGILEKTPGLADFILKRASSLSDILVKTSVKNLMFISGAEFVPGMANPAHWMKAKMMRHLMELPADFVIIDLGAGVHFNTLDFFGLADRGIIVTMPEPGAVMNAYGFIKAAFFRKIQNVFRHHPAIGPLIDAEATRKEDDRNLTLEWFSGRVKELAPDVFPLIGEISLSFRPGLVINRAPAAQVHILVKNLMSLCEQKIGVPLEYLGNVPHSDEITRHLLNIPRFLHGREGEPFFGPVRRIAGTFDGRGIQREETADLRDDFSDEERERIMAFMDTLDRGVFSPSSRDLMKLKIFFRPLEVIRFLAGRGVTHELFFRQ